MILLGDLRDGWPCPACHDQPRPPGHVCGVCTPLPPSAMAEQEPCERCGAPLRAGALPAEGGPGLGCRSCNPNMP